MYEKDGTTANQKQYELDAFDSTSAESDAGSISFSSSFFEEESSKDRCDDMPIYYKRSIDGAHIPTDDEYSECDEPHKKRMVFIHWVIATPVWEFVFIFTEQNFSSLLS